MTVTVEACSERPALVHTEHSDEVIEHSVVAPAGDLRVVPLMSGRRSSLPPLTPFGGGSYRLRVHASGRDIAPDAVAFEPREAYLIQAWPASPGPDLIHKQTDSYGVQTRRSAELGPSGDDEPQVIEEEVSPEKANPRAAMRRLRGGQSWQWPEEGMS